MNTRISEIDEEVKKLLAEKSELERIDRLPETERKISQYLSSRSGQSLLSQNSLSDYGIWSVYGEDPNCDFGGHHYNPKLGIVEGTLHDALVYAVEHPSFYQWGSGGYLEKTKITKL